MRVASLAHMSLLVKLHALSQCGCGALVPTLFSEAKDDRIKRLHQQQCSGKDYRVGQFYMPTKIVTGIGCFDKLPDIVREYGSKVLLVCGRSSMRQSGLLDRALGSLRSAQLETVVYD